MKLQSIRSKVQVIALTMVILIPVLESYKRLYRYLPPDTIGSLWRIYGSFADYAPEYLKGGYLSWLVVLIDALLGNLGGKTQFMQSFLSEFSGSYWSVTIAGLTFLDPLAFLQVILARQPVTWIFAFSALIPVILAMLLGRVFCSWLCPINTIFEVTRTILWKKYHRKALQLKLLTYPRLRYLLLGAGLLLTLAGVMVFPYILPYVLLGRFIYYLTTGTVFWIGLGFLISILLIDAFLQKGFWCNYLCPSGALLTLLGKKRLLSIKHNQELCNEHCSLCRNQCSWNANPKEEQFDNCTNCGLCVEKCPRKALSYRGKTQQPLSKANQPDVTS